jgi:hypothetical protein
MVTSFAARALLLAAIALSACGRPPARDPATPPSAPTAPDTDPATTAVPAAAPTPTAAATATEAATPTPASPPTPAPDPAATRALVRAVAAVEPAARTPLAHDGETVVDPASSFDVELAAPVRSVRLVLLDVADAHVAATAVREVGQATRLSLTPASPLVPGSRYVLRLEGAGGRELLDGAGAPLAPLSFALLAAGTPPPPEPKRPARRRKRR